MIARTRRHVLYSVLFFSLYAMAFLHAASAAVLSQNLAPPLANTYCSVNGCALHLGVMPDIATTTLYLYSQLGFQGWCDPPQIMAFNGASFTKPVANFSASAIWQSPTSTFSCSPYSSQNGAVALEYDGISLNKELSYAIVASAGDTSRGIDVPFTDMSGTFAYYRLADNLNDAFGASSLREPVVIVPGIMGSTLDRVSDGEEVWPNASKMLFSGSDSYLDDLKLDEGGTETTPLLANDIVRKELTLPFYEPLIQSFEADGYVEGSSLFVAPYDWRFSVASSSAAIASVIARAAAASPDGKVNVIAHSLGGLVMKEYLATTTDPPIHKLILAGVPQLGAPRAFKLLNYGDDLGMNVLGFGLNQNEAEAIAQNMPGVYDLLPSRRYIAVNGGIRRRSSKRRHAHA